MNRAAKEVHYLLKARTSVIWIVTGEERRVERAVASIAGQKGQGYKTLFWDCSQGCTDIEGNKVEIAVDIGIPDIMPAAVFHEIRQRKDRCVWILRDLHDWLGDVMNTRALRSLARDLQDELAMDAMQTVVVISPSAEIPLTLRQSVTMIDWPLPDRAEIESIVADVAAASNLPTNGKREAIIDAAAGLTASDTESALARSIVEFKKIDPAIVRAEKKRIIDRERVLTWYEPDPRGMDAIGGLGLLKAWTDERKCALTTDAKAYGLPSPKGVLLVGQPGCGKSLFAKSVATAWGIPLLRLDVGALKSKWLGESESNIRRALKVTEAVAPVVLWMDEVDKGLGGAEDHNDSGVSADALGTILTWRQECEKFVFVIATANDVQRLPPAFSRKGRFDEVFFVDLPTEAERAEILITAIIHAKRDPATFDLQRVAKATRDFSGAEIAELVPSGLFTSYAAKRELSTADLLLAASETVPVAQSAAEKIAALRAWATSRARRASAKEAAPAPSVKGSRAGRPINLLPETGPEEQL